MKQAAQRAHMDLRGSLKKVKSGVFNFDDVNKSLPNDN